VSRRPIQPLTAPSIPPLIRARRGRVRAALARPRGDAPTSVAAAGQATVELIAFLPLLLAAGLAAAVLLAGQSAGEQAGQGAQAGAMALIQGGDPRAAARAALPAAVRRRATVGIEGRRVTVRVRPRAPLPSLASLVTATATADAGPEPVP
jgi:hypothetical protein